MIQVKLENEHAEDESDRPHPLIPTSELLWKVERELTKVQEDYIFSEDLFEWTLVLAQESRRFRRIVQTTEAITGRR